MHDIESDFAPSLAHTVRHQFSIALTLLVVGCGGSGGGSSAPTTPSPTPAADSTPPVITLSGSDAMTLTEGDSYTEPGATAIDDVDGSVTVVISGGVGNSPGDYTVIYTATDAAGNESSTSRQVVVQAAAAPSPESLSVFDNGLAGDTWDLGLNAFDQGINFDSCSNDNGDACPNIAWQIVTDQERGAVIEISHSSAGMITGFFIKTSTPQDLTRFAGGTLEFDARIISGDPALTMKVDCIFPCTSGDFDLQPINNTEWETITVQINDLVAQDLDLTTVDTGIVIWATVFTDTVFRVDNVRWIANPDGPVTEPVDSGSDTEPNLNLTGPTSPSAYDGFTLLWSDEFDGSDLNQVNWNYEIGTGENGWGNNELQYYRAENTTVQNGLLVISAKEENFAGQQYTSSRLTTNDKFSFRYGRIDIRAAMPKGQGLWPALWMLGQNIDTVGWPDCGEIDIMEMIGGSGREDTVHGTAHWSNENAHAQFGSSHQLSDGDTLADGFNVYSLIWTEDVIQWYIGDIQYHQMDIDSSPGLSAFQKEFFLIVNIAVGGNFPGSPNTNTQFSQHMLVDYIRVFQQD